MTALEIVLIVLKGNVTIRHNNDSPHNDSQQLNNDSPQLNNDSPQVW